MANPFPFSSGDVLTAANLNSIGQWSTYTPVLTSSGTNPNIGNGSVNGYYCQINEIVFFQAWIQFGTSGTSAGSGTYYVSLPVNAATGSGLNIHMGASWYYDSSVPAGRAGISQLATTDKLQMLTTDIVGVTVTSTNPFTWGVNDQIRCAGSYKAA